MPARTLTLSGSLFKFHLMELSSSLELASLVEGGGWKERMLDLDLVAVFSVTPADSVRLSSRERKINQNKTEERKEPQTPKMQKQFH